MGKKVVVNITVEGDINLKDGQPLRYEVPGIDAVDSLDPVIEKSTSIDVEVQPATAQEKIKFLLITSDNYGEKLKYKIDGGSKEVAIDAPQLLMGVGAVGLLEKSPVKIHIANDMTVKATVNIYVARAAS